MGKKQHQRDKLWLTTTESYLFGGKKQVSKTHFKRLPFANCSISLAPFTKPVCTIGGVTFDEANIVNFVKKYGINPVTGDKMDTSELIELHYHKNSDGKYHCPVTFKLFTENSHIVALRTTGHVYDYSALDTLSFKTGSMRDPLTDTTFTKQDIIVLQDPNDLEKFNICSFYYMKMGLEVEQQKQAAGVAPSVNAETRDTLQELRQRLDEGSVSVLPPSLRSQENASKSTSGVPARDRFNIAPYSTGRVGASLTATTMEPVTVLEAAILPEEQVRYGLVKKKGYVQIVTNLGTLNVELHCDLTPRTCENFVLHCESGYYVGTLIHRVVRNFVLQGGDPTGTGRGGKSAFKDCFNFITFRTCEQLNGKHTVFGRLVGGLATLDAIERVPVDEHDKPKEPVRIESTTVFVNPFTEVDEMLRRERSGESNASASSGGASSSSASHSGTKRGAASASSFSASASASAPGNKRSRPDTAGSSAALPLTASILESAARAADQRSAAAAADRRSAGTGATQATSSRLVAGDAGGASSPAGSGNSGRLATGTSGGVARPTAGGTKLVRTSASDVAIRKPNPIKTPADSGKLTNVASTVGKYLKL